MARIVYREIAEENEAHAMNKLIYEVANVFNAVCDMI
jgi:hypothetical protein